MKKYSLCFAPVFFLFFFFAQTAWSQGSVQHQKDSLRRVIPQLSGKEKFIAYKHLSLLYFYDVRKDHVIDTLLNLYDELDAEARKVGNISFQAMARSNKIVALINKGLYQEVIRQAPDCLEFLLEVKKMPSYYQVKRTLANAYIRENQHEQALQTLEQALQIANSQNDPAGRGTTLFAMARAYNQLGRYADTEECLRECITLLQDSIYYRGTLADAYYDLMSNQVVQKNYEEAERIGEQYVELIKRYDNESEAPQRTSWINLWLGYTELYNQWGDYDKAAYYADKIDSIGQGAIKQYETRAQIYYGKGDYDKALEMVDKEIELRHPNTLQANGLKLLILIKKGEADSAADLFRKVVAEKDSTRNALFDSRLDEIRTRYEVDKLVTEKQRNRIYFLAALSGCILLLLLAGGTIYYNRIISKKNYNLYLQIKNQDQLLDELAQIKKHDPQTAGDAQQRKLVERLRQYLQQNTTFAHADTAVRDELATALSTNKNTLSEAVKAVSGQTLMEYVKAVQLEETRRLLDKRPELTIEAIAYECGFNAPSTFYRLFKKYYGISPAEYRKIGSTITK